MKRREVLTFLGSRAASSSLWPLSALAQEVKLPMIGFIIDGTVDAWARHSRGFSPRPRGDPVRRGPGRGNRVKSERVDLSRPAAGYVDSYAPRF